jgi:membrane protein DedA with SNARE-associated domain
VSGLVAQLGPLGVFLLMVPESACVPLPSELTLMSAGFGVHQGWFGFPVAVAAATAGNLTGSLITYWLGRHGALERLSGRGRRAVAGCERLFAQRGESTVFIARLLPLARTFVSLPAGHVGVPLWRFVAWTVPGCAIWSAAFVFGGSMAGAGYEDLATAAGRVSVALASLGALGFSLAWLRRRARRHAAR